MLPGVSADDAPYALPSETEIRQAQQIATSLAAGRVAEALTRADKSLQQFPESRLLRIRRAQARLSEATELTIRYDQSVPEVLAAKDLSYVEEMIRSYSNRLKKKTPAQDAQYQRLVDVVTGEEAIRLRDRARAGLKESGSVIERRHSDLMGAAADIREARERGDRSTELELTGFWTHVLALCQRQGLQQLQVSAREGLFNGALDRDLQLKEALQGIEKPLASFAEVTPDAVLRAAAEFGRSHRDDPAALAGAADVLSIVGALANKPDPLWKYGKLRLDHRYLAQGQAPVLVQPSQEAAAQQYEQALTAEDVDPTTNPAAMALQFYHQALARDTRHSLPYLPLRVFLLRLPFDQEAAEPLLESLSKRQPRNSAVLLERTREAFLVDGRPAAALSHCRDAVRLAEFSRSYFVSVPPPLRPALSNHPALQALVKKAWPGYEYLFVTLLDMQAAQADDPSRMEFRLLRLRIAERLCEATDYADRATGVHQKTLVLRELLELGDRLPAEQRAALQRELREHAHRFSGLPRTPGPLVISESGMAFRSYPDIGAQPDTGDGPHLFLSPGKGSVLAAFMKRSRPR